MSNNASQVDLFNSPDDTVQHNVERCVSVLVPYPVDKAYDYAVPEGENLQPGDYVIVPLGGREISAVVWGEAAGDVNPQKIKAIVNKHKAKPMAKSVRDFIDWVADYTMTPRGFVLKMALSVPQAFVPPKPAKGYQAKEQGAAKLTDKQQKVIPPSSVRYKPRLVFVDQKWPSTATRAMSGF